MQFIFFFECVKLKRLFICIIIILNREELEKLKSVIGESKKSKRKGQQPSPVVIGAEEGLKMLTYDLKQQTSEVRLM